MLTITDLRNPGLAEAVLLDGVARQPGDPALWVARLTSARGLQMDLAEIRRRYGKLAAIDPQHLPGQIQFMQSLCPKWSGSWELLHPWCRAVMLASAPGSLQAGLVVDGHIERLLEIGDDGRAVAYLSGDAVRAEIYEAARRSIGHPDFRREYGWVSVVSSFAFVFTMLQDQHAAAQAFRLLGDLASEYPWNYSSGDPAETIRRTRAWALSPTGTTR